MVGLGDIKQPTVLLALFGFLLIVVLHQLKVRGAIIISILVVTAIATALGLNQFKGVVGQIPSIAPTFMQMDFKGLFTAVWSVSSSYSSLLTCLTVRYFGWRFTPRGLLKDGKLPRLKKALFGLYSYCCWCCMGTSSTTPISNQLQV